ncbi:MAG TPA: hypothetical protein VKT28_14270 [Puia sp.]|nr:hypothetical protein [Puia sp.]
MKNTLLVIFVLLACSCASLKQKKDFVSYKMKSLQKYSIDSSDFALSISNGNKYIFLSDDELRKIKMKELRKQADELEKIIALYPDSISNRLMKGAKLYNRLDSFYANRNKISFIVNNNLITPNKHFLERWF